MFTWTEIRKQWASLFSAAVWLCSVVATFLVPASFLEEQWINLTRYVVAIVAGLFLILALILKDRRYLKLWVGLTIVFLVTGVAAYFINDTLIARWSVIYPRYTSSRVLIGKTYTDFARSVRDRFFRENKRYPDDEQIVWQNLGKTEDLWPRAEIEARHRWAAILYIANVVLPAVCIISIIRASNCLQRA
jgi:hypothetical protein